MEIFWLRYGHKDDVFKMEKKKEATAYSLSHMSP